eukprot:195295-Chlamydomonas_euryale.AAC.1
MECGLRALIKLHGQCAALVLAAVPVVNARSRARRRVEQDHAPALRRARGRARGDRQVSTRDPLGEAAGAGHTCEAVEAGHMCEEVEAGYTCEEVGARHLCMRWRQFTLWVATKAV